ncbi:MAG: hydrolase [Oscillospiraceae bacterium]|nr:hydrolase [Oscillospiraceae bacterium]
MKRSIVKKIKSYNLRSRNEFKSTMSDLLDNEKILRLAEYRQHYKSTRLKHSIDVAYFSFYIAKILKLDYISTGKAGLMHDLSFHEDSGFRENVKMLRQHPKDALKNALEICDLSEKERDIIRRHMWLITLHPPKYTEGYIVTFVDKYCAAKEFFAGVFSTKSVYKDRF